MKIYASWSYRELPKYVLILVALISEPLIKCLALTSVTLIFIIRPNFSILSDIIDT